MAEGETLRQNHLQALALARRLETSGFSDLAGTLEHAALLPDPTCLRAILVGRFSVGKSTLINAFLGYPVLPGGLAPTTGVLCQVQYGAPGAEVRFNDGSIERLSGPEALQSFAAIQTNNDTRTSSAISQDRESDSRAVAGVTASLPLPLLEDGLVILDSPGLDEDLARMERTCAGIEKSDILVFVLSADQLFSDTERRFLLDQALPRGTGAVALVVNFWDRVPQGSESGLTMRLQDAARTVQDLWQELSGEPAAVGTFTLSALRALRSRWKPEARRPPDRSVEALEQWLRDQTRAAARVKFRAFRGHLRFAAGTAARLLSREHENTRVGLNDVHLRLKHAREGSEAAVQTRESVVPLLRAESEALAEFAARRVESLQSDLSVTATSRLRAQPYSRLDDVRIQLKQGWNAVLVDVAREVASALSRVISVLNEGGLEVGSDALPWPVLPATPPAWDYSPPETAVSVRDTLTGLLGSISGGAADRAASALEKAHQAAFRHQARNSTGAETVAATLETALSVGAYELRSALRQWSSELEAAVFDQIRRWVAGKEAAVLELQGRAKDSRCRAEELLALARDLEAFSEQLRIRGEM